MSEPLDAAEELADEAHEAPEELLAREQAVRTAIAFPRRLTRMIW